MIFLLITAYIYSLFFIFLATVSLILLGLGWGRLPHKYLELVTYIQELFPKVFFVVAWCLPFAELKKREGYVQA